MKTYLNFIRTLFFSIIILISINCDKNNFLKKDSNCDSDSETVSWPSHFFISATK